MKSKKMTICRLVIFLVLSCAPLWVMCFLLNNRYDGYFWLNAPAGVLTLTGLVGMFFPTIANLLTRLLTREGSKDSFFSFRLKGKLRYYVAAVLVKVTEAFAGALLIIAVYLKEFSVQQLFEDTQWKSVLPIMLFSVGSLLFLFMHGFGEEFGWRGYMMPKLMELMSAPVAIVVGGVLWGLWHAPLTIAGHNFGIDYPGYSWKGILFMCVSCVLINAFLTFLTVRSGSVFPAAICHSVHNGFTANIVLQYLICESALARVQEISANQLPWLLCLTTAVTALVSLFLLMRKPAKKS